MAVAVSNRRVRLYKGRGSGWYFAEERCRNGRWEAVHLRGPGEWWTWGEAEHRARRYAAVVRAPLVVEGAEPLTGPRPAW